MKKSSKKKAIKAINAEVTPSEAIQEEHYHIIDEYFNNGMNGTKAVQSLRPEINYNSAKLVFHNIAKSDHGRRYIAERRKELRASTQLAGEQIARTMLAWAYGDATQYVGLTPDELRALPNEQKACIQSIKYRSKNYTDRTGKEVTEEVCDVVLVDKLKALDKIAKHIDWYNADNRSKQGAGGLNELLKNEATPSTIEALNTVVKAIKQSNDSNS